MSDKPAKTRTVSKNSGAQTIKRGGKGSRGGRGGKAALRAGPSQVGPLRKRGLFSADLPPMMFGFGDAQIPRQESVDLIEDMVAEYLVRAARQAQSHAELRDGSLQAADVLFLVRKDTVKHTRCKELLDAHALIKAAKWNMDDPEVIAALKGE